MSSHIRRTRFIEWVMFAVAILAALAAAQACRGRTYQDDKESAAKTPAAPVQIGVQNGETNLTLDPQMQQRLGIKTLVLAETSIRLERTAPAVVLSAQGLANLLNAYVAGRAQLEKTRIRLNVARQEYVRLKTLYQDDRNASEKSLESADGTVRAAEADQGAAQQQLGLQTSVARQQWGAVVARWIAADSAELQRVLASSEMLVQVTIPAAEPPLPPARIALDNPAGGRVGANLVSGFPRVDPRVQGVAFLYATPARAGLAPGANLVAHLATGKPRRGVIVPQTAVIWWQGAPSVYVETGAGKFTRQAVQTDNPVAGGFFVTSMLAPGSKVVIRGPQQLLSIESTSAVQAPGGEGDTD